MGSKPIPTSHLARDLPVSTYDRETIIRGVATGEYIGTYTPKISRTLAYVSSLLAVLFTCGTLTCFDFEIGMTS